VSVARPLEIREELDGERGRLTLTGELDIATVPRLREVTEAIIAGGVRQLTIDLGPLEFLDSSGLREFIVLRDRADAEGWVLALLRPAQPALSVFRITRAEENLPFVEESPPG
jgi:anti-anti-sigma factor